MPMPAIEWRHNRERLILPIVILPGYNSLNPTQTLQTNGLLDTGATGTGIRGDLARALELRPKGQRRVLTANGDIMAQEYLFRVGFVCGDYTDPHFDPLTQQPYVLDKEVLGFELGERFPYPMLIGMDVIAQGDLAINRSGTARLMIG